MEIRPSDMMLDQSKPMTMGHSNPLNLNLEDEPDFDFFKPTKEKKGRFMDRFNNALKKDKKIYSSDIPTKIDTQKRKRQEEVATNIKHTLEREKKVNLYEVHEKFVVGENNFEKNLEVEIEAEKALLEQLFECPEGCGRSFRKEALERHIKVCKKVFQTKRKEFEIQEKRMLNKEQKILAKKGERKMEVQKNLNNKNKKKWMKESEKFRKIVKDNQDGNPIEDTQNDPTAKIRCEICGSKFMSADLVRHEKLCKVKAKAIKKKK